MLKTKGPQSINTMAFFNLLGPIVINGVNFFTIPIFTRLLGTAGYGVITIYASWLSIFSIIVGLQTHGSISIAKVHLDEDEQKNYRSSSLSISFCMFVAMFLTGILAKEPLSIFLGIDSGLIWILILHSFGTFAISFGTSCFIYDKRATYSFALSVITTILTISISIIWVSSIGIYEDRFLGRIMGMALPTIIIGLGVFVWILADGKTLFSKKYWAFCLPICLPLILHGLSGVLLAQTDKLMLMHFTDDDSLVGIYGLAVSLTGLISVLWVALNSTWTPFYYDDMKANGQEVIIKRTKGYMLLFTSFVLTFLMASPEIIRIMAPPEFATASDFIPPFVVSMYMVFLYSFPVNFQFYHKKTVFIAIGTFSATVLNIILNSFMIPEYGGMGAAIATMIAYIALFAFHQFIASKLIKQPYTTFGFKQFYLSLIAVIVGVLVFYFSKDIWLVRWAIAITACVLAIGKIVKNRTIF